MNSEISAIFNQYPPEARLRLEHLRSLFLNLRDELGLGEVEESLKWGEPSYTVKGGSPVRMAWKAKHPDHVCLYFICTTPLVATFRELYRDKLTFEGNRTIVLPLSKPVPEAEVAHCLSLAMTYQSIKHLPNLGA
ncbi:DUF1801 domain-containing protein [Reinekea blandensis]|uniref:YdhG-like domain-containing protein n=1 Tax=Reinekea blandensis MED297 TaxID=314283 RepID=A4BB95_9GAMM|nr:DUF1801 domain-containing protein [Reinekea blandensis]EAR10708.1 hypothetical protein MED297_11850 [Reinekea sp. MED297] [Reinekea blandensis MED297]